MPLSDLIDATNASLKTRGIRLKVEQRRQGLSLRGTWADAQGIRKQRRLPIGINATPAGLLQAETSAVAAWAAITSGTDPAAAIAQPTPEDSTSKTVGSVEDVIQSFQTDFWSTRARTAAAERTWERIANELQRLPSRVDLTLPLLEATICGRTQPDTRSRLEACKVYKRLALFAGLEGVAQLDRLRGTYEPAERDLPTDEQLIQFLDEVRPTKWGWVMAAAAVYGVRPAEVPSLVFNDDGTATAITLKRHGRKPTLRTCFALPSAWIDRWELQSIQIPNDARWTRPEDYSSDEGRRWVNAWRHGLRGKAVKQAIDQHLGEFDNVALRHCWAVRSISSGLPVSLCAKAMGHSVAVHEKQYHRWLAASTLQDALSRLDV